MTCKCSEQEIVDKILLNHSVANQEDLIPILQETQEALGYLPVEAMEKIAHHLLLSVGEVYGVATFYAQFRLVPSGKNRVTVCRGTACHVRGGNRILKEVTQRLGIKPGETTQDMEYTLETVACIGACALAPNLTINNAVHGQLTTKKVGEIFSDRSKKNT
jgi:NADH:ubiquinone oxidoreductase subunit E